MGGEGGIPIPSPVREHPLTPQPGSSQEHPLATAASVAMATTSATHKAPATVPGKFISKQIHLTPVTHKP